MGIFDLFRKKKTDSTFPENELEQSLVDAASSTSAQKSFYQKLLWSQLYVLTTDHDDNKEHTDQEEESVTVQFVAFEGGQIPVFTAKNRIFDKGVVKKKVPYLSLKGQDLFDIAKGLTFILNPYSDYGKELVPEEINSLLDGSIYDKIDEQEKEHEKFRIFNETFEKAAQQQKGLIFLDGYHRKKLKESEKIALEASVQGFQKCLDQVPDNWQSMFLMAKALQRLERHAEALHQLEQALSIELENHSIPMEASLEAMHLKDFDKALQYSEESLKRQPNNVALLGNHAMNLLVAERDLEAKETIEKAIKIKSNDSVNRNIESIIRDVSAGKRDRPTFDSLIK